MNTQLKQLKRISEWGFVLVEAMVVTALLVFGFVGGTQTQSALIKDQAYTNQQSQSTHYLNENLEQIRNYGSIAQYNNISSGTNSISASPSSYSLSWTVTNHTGYKKVAQTLSWTGTDAVSYSNTTSTYISDNDPQKSGELLNSSNKSTQLPTPGGSNNSNTDTSQSSTPEYTTITVPGTDIQLTYDQYNNVVSINGNHAVTISGQVSIGTGGLRPSGNISLSNITVTQQSINTIVATCSYSTGSGAISCIMASGWRGYVLLGGVSNVRICGSNNQPYAPLLQSLNNQNFLVIRTGKSCPATYPYLLQDL